MRTESFICFCSLFLVVSIICSNVVNSFPNGAGGCAGGVAAVGGSHLTADTVLSRTLKQEGVKVSVGGVTIAAGKTGVVPYGKLLNIEVTGNEMKGILIRLRAPSGVSTSGVLAPGSGLKRAAVCSSPVVGVTQKNNEEVNSYVSTIQFKKSTPNVVFDITIVYDNENEDGESESEYAYGRIKVNFTKTA